MEFNFSSSDINKHSAAHVLAAAVKRVFPSVKVGIGPVTKTGFFYDFDLDIDLTNKDLEKIQIEIDALIQEDLQFQQVSMSKEIAQNALMQAGQIYKLELLQKIQDEHVSFYKLGSEFTDLCRGPHVNKTSEIGIVKVSKCSKVHWLEDDSKPLLTRISGHVFKNSAEVKEFEEFVEHSREENFISRGIRTNLLIPLKNKTEEKLYVLNNQGSKIVTNIEKYTDRALEDFNVEFLDIDVSASNQSISDATAKFFTSKNISYRKLPIIYKTRYRSPYISDLLRNMSGTILDYVMYFDSGHNHMVTNVFFDKVIGLAKDFTKDEVRVDIETTDLHAPFMDSFTNFLSKSIVSHNKVLVKNTKGTIDLKFIATKNKTTEVIFEIIFIEKNTANTLRNYKNEIIQTSSIEFQVNTLSLLKFLVEAFDRDIPFILKPLHIVFIPQNKTLVEEVISFVEEIHFSSDLFYEIDTSSKSLSAKVQNAEKKEVDFICIVGEKELKNNAVSLRQNNQLVGLLTVDSFIQKLYSHVS